MAFLVVSTIVYVHFYRVDLIRSDISSSAVPPRPRLRRLRRRGRRWLLVI